MPRMIKAGLEGHWARVLDDFAGNNCSISQYCQHLNISKSTLYKWSQRLGIPLKSNSNANEGPIKQKNAPSLTSECDPPFSFIELNVPQPAMAAPLPVKFELILSQGSSLKIEAPSSWNGVIGLAKALMS